MAELSGGGSLSRGLDDVSSVDSSVQFGLVGDGRTLRTSLSTPSGLTRPPVGPAEAALRQRHQDLPSLPLGAKRLMDKLLLEAEVDAQAASIGGVSVYHRALRSSLDVFPNSSTMKLQPLRPLSKLPSASSVSAPNLHSSSGPKSASPGPTPGFSMANIVAAAKGAKGAKEAQALALFAGGGGSGGGSGSSSGGGGGGKKLGAFGAKMLWQKAAAQIKIDCTQRKAKLIDDAPEWWPVPERVLVAADSFDLKYRTNVARAERIYYFLEHHHSTAEECDQAFDSAWMDVNATRYFEPERAQQQAPRPGTSKKPQKPRYLPRGGTAAPVAVNKFDVMKSIWAPRAKWADSKSVYDTDEVIAQRFTNDWNRALELGIVKMVLTYDDDAAQDDDGDGVPDEVVEVGTVLWENAELYFAIFSYYASIGGDVYSLGLNDWSLLTSEFGLVQKKSQFCKRSDMDQLFLAVDLAAALVEKKKKAMSKLGSISASHDDKTKALNRVEFVAALVMLSINKYVRTDTKYQISDVSEALKRLLEVDLQSHFRPELLAPPNAFRRAYCYTEGVNAVLRKHETELRIIYEVMSASEAGESDSLMSLPEWRLAMRATNMVPDVDLGDRDMTMCFVWSRVCVVDGRTARGHARESSLPFEGFLEALCRVAALKALPTDEEIRMEEHADDAFTFLENMRERDAPGHAAFLRERANVWGTRPRQPFDRCVSHIISMIFGQIRRGPGADPSSAITRHTVQKWAKASVSAFAKFSGGGKFKN